MNAFKVNGYFMPYKLSIKPKVSVLPSHKLKLQRGAVLT